MNNIKKQILDANKSDSFSKELYKIYLQEKNDSNTFYQTLVSLHNSDKINFTHALEGVKVNITDGLQHLLEKDQDMVVTYLEKVLMRNKELSITSFDDLLRDLHQKHNNLLNPIITKWFITGDINLCKAIMDIIRFFNSDKMTLSADMGQLKNQDSVTHLFVIKKAIGWLFHHPISVVSFIVSMIEILDEDNVRLAEDLLFDPLLVSYPGSVKKYLESIKNPKTQTKIVIYNLLKRLEKYHNDLECSWNIKELKPSQEQRESFSRFHNQLMSKAMQESEKNSFWSSIVGELVILYGRKNVIYHSGLGNSNNDTRQEMVPQKFSHSTEYPSLDFIDPHGLDYMLRVFKNEQFKK